MNKNFENSPENLSQISFLKNKIESLNAILNNSPDIIARIDHEFRHIFINKAIETATGIPVEVFLGKTHTDLGMDMDVVRYWHQKFHSAFNTGTEQVYEFDFPTPSGTKYYHCRLIPEMNEKNEVVSLLSVARDISDLKKVELTQKELLLSEERYLDLITNLEVGIVVHGSDTAIIMNNSRASELLGLSNEQLRGKFSIDPQWKFIDEDFLTLPVEAYPVNKILTSGKPIKNKIYGICHSDDKVITWVNVNGFPFYNTEGKISEIVISFIDYTQRINTSNLQKKYLKELETLNNTKDKFFGIIAHDLRNPFAGIIGLTDVMKSAIESMDEEDNLEKIKKYIEMIQGSARSTVLLLENLLTWARTQTDDIKLNQQKISILSIFLQILPILNGNLETKKIELVVNLPEDNFVYADEFMTRTILLNLLTNAIKFSYFGTKIIVSSQKKDSFLQVSIEDFGTGIDTVSLNNIFKIESKFSKQGTNKEKGSGLGLIICKEFVEKQGGKIWIESEVKKGSTVHFTLSLVQ